MARSSRAPRPSNALPKARSAGFTLIEVLIALAMLAIALIAVTRAMGQAIDTSTGLRDRTVALWAAQERAVRHQVQRTWPALDTTEGTLELGGREWRWRERVSTTEVPEIRRMDIEVRSGNSPDILGRVAIYLAQPSAPASTPPGSAP